MTSTIQNLAPIMPFIEPTEPLEPSAIFELAQNGSSKSSNQHAKRLSQDRKGKAPISGASQTTRTNPVEHARTASQDEALLDKTRRELEDKISELNKLKNQLAETEHRARQLESQIPA